MRDSRFIPDEKHQLGVLNLLRDNVNSLAVLLKIIIIPQIEFEAYYQQPLPKLIIPSIT